MTDWQGLLAGADPLALQLVLYLRLFASLGYGRFHGALKGCTGVGYFARAHSVRAGDCPNNGVACIVHAGHFAFGFLRLLRDGIFLGDAGGVSHRLHHTGGHTFHFDRCRDFPKTVLKVGCAKGCASQEHAARKDKNNSQYFAHICSPFMENCFSTPPLAMSPTVLNYRPWLPLNATMESRVYGKLKIKQRFVLGVNTL
jgi:hypothetical protein